MQGFLRCAQEHVLLHCRYYWEMVIMFRKMLVVFILVFFEGESVVAYRSMFGLWLMTAFLMLNIFLKPFMYSRLWVLENLSLGSVSLSLNLSMLYSDEYQLRGAGETVVTLCILATNLCTLLTFAYVMVFDAGMEIVYDTFDVKATGDLTWNDIVYVARVKAYTALAPVMRKVGVTMDNPDDNAEAEEASELVHTTFDQARAFKDAKSLWAHERALRRLELVGEDVADATPEGGATSDIPGDTHTAEAPSASAGEQAAAAAPEPTGSAQPRDPHSILAKCRSKEAKSNLPL